ncbi:MAG: M56 family metallopeptidase [Bacteroidales bacterium]
MIEFIIYALKTIIGLGLFALVYRMGFLKDVNFPGRRFYLLNAVFLSFLLPLLSFNFSIFSTGESTPFGSFVLDEITVYSNGLKTIEQSSRIPFSEILVYSYIVIAFLLAARVLYQLVNILAKTKKYRGDSLGKLILYRLPVDNVSFSFFNFVFIGKTPGEEDMEKILAHEKVHAGQLHTLDVLIMEILTIIFWFNPLVWWFRNEIKNVHEYLADDGALNEGFNRKSYQITLLEHLIGSASLTITNNFNYSLIKNRIAMMNKEKNGRKNIWKIFLLLPVSIMLIIGFACTEKAETTDMESDEKKSEAYYEPAYQHVDVMPEFPGGFDALRKFAAKNLKYPDKAKENGVAGRVMVQFVVDKEGKIVTNTKEYKIEGEENILDGVVVVAYEPADGMKDEANEEYIQLLKEEAVRVLSSLPSFESPAKKNGKPVAVAFTFPINFALQ